ncbi:hypothetical protein ACJJI5_21825 [Microbulbifer sp. EKSA008]|uniref:hypothetical protein n=1 Tax=Microbulbifer sp. EKSA008 TaxID=3243367 RepID=UPI0040410A80
MSEIDPIGSSRVIPVYRKLALVLAVIFIIAICGVIVLLIAEGFDWFLIFGLAMCSWSARFFIRAFKS